MLRKDKFRNFILGRFIFIMGLRMSGTVVAWWMYDLTHSALALGLLGLSEVVPALSFALYAGHYIDRNEKRKLLLRCVILYMCCMLLFYFVSDPFSTASHSPWRTASIVFSIIALTGAIRAFSGPTFASMIGQLVRREHLPTAASMSSATWLVASITGHALGGFMIAWMGVHYTFLVILGLIIFGYFFLFQLPLIPVVVRSKTAVWQSVREGLSYVFKTKEILGALTLDLFAVLFGGAVALIPMFAKDVLHVGPEGFGWLNAASDIGSIISVSLLTIAPLRRKQGKKLLLCVAGFGISIIFFALSTAFWISFAMLMLSGLLDGVSMVVRGTILQLKTPEELRGRVMSVNSMFINSSNELGQFESGIAAKWLGLVPSVIVGGSITVLVAIITWFKAPGLREMEY